MVSSAEVFDKPLSIHYDKWFLAILFHEEDGLMVSTVGGCLLVGIPNVESLDILTLDREWKFLSGIPCHDEIFTTSAHAAGLNVLWVNLPMLDQHISHPLLEVASLRFSTLWFHLSY